MTFLGLSKPKPIQNSAGLTSKQINQMVTISKTRPQHAQTSAGHPLESQSARQVDGKIRQHIYHYQSIAQSVENVKIGMG